MTGKIEKEIWWYNPNYNASISSREIKVDSDKLYKFTRQTKNKLKRIQYRGKAENFIRLYNRALDEDDWSTSFIRLWQVLEEITGTRKANYDVTIRRASFLYEDPEYHRGMLNHLREIRNSYIHSGSETLTIESSLYLLKNYVEKIMMFHLRNAGTFRSIAEVAEVLSFPAAKEELLKKERLIKIALKIQG